MKKHSCPDDTSLYAICNAQSDSHYRENKPRQNDYDPDAKQKKTPEGASIK